ncbi:MAG: hypothetical protein GWN58_10685, partial [Anaerolineae bacterium]|nr:hypothetical protein [Anaerolineae bacterium]
NAADDPQLEADLATLCRRIEADLPTSERLVEELDLAFFLQEANRHSLQRIHALLSGRRVP